ncbi:hypothetical protein [Burkholderia cepacia]|uniref:hypothetical protein n=1 Tax=Burkholderia cepacia TaxID=292 RepID=UPI001CF2EBF3|nr:hypothetical protein [Burkholderia cepacia]MCA8349179.1 hypothetical protein [Burkholderia cepacia]
MAASEIYDYLAATMDKRPSGMRIALQRTVECTRKVYSKIGPIASEIDFIFDKNQPMVRIYAFEEYGFYTQFQHPYQVFEFQAPSGTLVITPAKGSDYAVLILDE